MRLEDLQPRRAVRGRASRRVGHGRYRAAVRLRNRELTSKTSPGALANELLYPPDESRLEIVANRRPWSFDRDRALCPPASEAQQIRLAQQFDPVLAAHTSAVNPLPHKITAVSEALLPRQPLRLLLADDPGTAMTIVAGRPINGDLERFLIVCPGSRAEQWRNELHQREAVRTRNWFRETNPVIRPARQAPRDEDVQQKFQAPDATCDLVACDEAHKLLATFVGGEMKYDTRHRLAHLLSGLTRHHLFMTAPPHNGRGHILRLRRNHQS